MGSKWETVRLNEVATLRNGAGVKQQFFADNGIPLARVSDFTLDSIDISDCKYVEEAHAETWASHYIDVGDVLVSTVGSWPPNWSSVVGKVVRAPVNVSGAIQNQNTCCILPNQAVLDNRYLFYRLKSEDFTWHTSNNAGGSANQARLPVKKLGEFQFLLPPLSVQRLIANILGALDDKITLNSQTNQTLEKMAQTLFKSWFVDFDPVKAKMNDEQPKGMAAPFLSKTVASLFPEKLVESELGLIPEGWSVRPLGSLIDFMTGFAFKSKQFTESGVRLARGDNVKEGRFHWGDKSRYWPDVTPELEKYHLQSGDILIGMDGSKVGKNWVRVNESDLPCLLVQRVARLREKGLVGSSMLEVIIGGNKFKRYVENVKTGTSIPHISGKQIKDMPILYPNDGGKLFQRFEELLLPLAQKRELNNAENQELTRLRDTLLPKLLSGEIDLENVQVEAAKAIVE